MKQRRITIRKFWGELADDLRQNPMKFYKTFKPFRDRKDKGDGDIPLNMEHGTWNTSGNGGENVESLDESEFIEHSSLKPDCFKWHIQPKKSLKLFFVTFTASWVIDQIILKSSAIA